MSRITSQQAKLYVQTDDALVPLTITGATAAKPCVLTFGAAPATLPVGKIARIDGTGWRSLDGRSFQISEVAAMTVTLYDSDTSDEASTMTAGATASPVEMIEACLRTTVVTRPAGTDIDATTMCDEARETISGLPGIATWTATGFWDQDDASQDRLVELYRSGEKVAMSLMFVDHSGLVFTSNVNNHEANAGVDQAVQITVGGTISGPVHRLVGTTAVVALAPAGQQPAQPAVAA